MPGIADAIIALTGGALQGYGAQVAKQRAAKTALVLQTLKQYPEAAGDSDFAKLAASAGIDKDALPGIAQAATLHQKAVQTNSQNAIQQFKTLQQGANGGNAQTPGAPSSDAFGTALQATPGAAGTTPQGVPQTAPQMTSASPQASQAAPTVGGPGITPSTPIQQGQAGGLQVPPTPPPPPKLSMTINPKTGEPSYTTSFGVANLAEQDQEALNQVMKLQKRYGDQYPIGTIIDAVRESGRPLKPATEEHIKTVLGQAAFSHYVQQFGGDSQENWLRAAHLVISRDMLTLPSSVLTLLQQQSPTEKALEAGMVANARVPAAEAEALYNKQTEARFTEEIAASRARGSAPIEAQYAKEKAEVAKRLEVENAQQIAANRAKGELPYQKELIGERAIQETLKNATTFIKPDGTPGMVTAADRAMAGPAMQRLMADTKQDRADIDAYNQLMGLLQHSHGLSQVDLLIAFNRLSSHGRTNQAGIEHDIDTGVPASQIWSKWFGLRVSGDIITQGQVQQISDSALSMYQQAKRSLDRKTTNTAVMMDKGKPGLHSAFIPEHMGEVVNPQTGSLVNTAIAPPVQTLSAHGIPAPAGVDPALWEAYQKRLSK